MGAQNPGGETRGKDPHMIIAEAHIFRDLYSEIKWTS